jgi:hypothetical protein
LTIFPKIEKFIQDGVLFTIKTGHLFLLIVFVKTLLKSFKRFNHNQLIQYLDQGIYKSFEHVDFETFPVWFYVFKVFLYFQLGIKSVTIKKLFNGAFMNEVNERTINVVFEIISTSAFFFNGKKKIMESNLVFLNSYGFSAFKT